MILPTIRSRKDYLQAYTEEAVWLPAMRTLCQRHGRRAGSLRRMTLGSHVVFCADDVIIKLFCPLWSEDFKSERACLAHIRGLSVPQLIAEGELEGWPYLLITVVPGIPAGELWDKLDRAQQQGIVTELGQIMSTLHALPTVPELDDDWAGFIQARIDGADQHHAADEPFRGWIRQRLARFREPPFPHVLLSADITEDHLLLSERAGRWRITGFIDFGDARMGHPYYEFIAPLAFYTIGKPELSRMLVEAYGLELTAELADDLTSYCLLHEFGRLAHFLERFAAEDGPAFHRALWGDI